MSKTDKEARNKQYLMAQPTRLRICQLLLELEDDSDFLPYPASIARKLGMKGSDGPRVVSFHLSKLQAKGLATSKFGLMNPVDSTPKAVRYYSLTDEAREIARKLL